MPQQCSTGQHVSPDAATFCVACGAPVLVQAREVFVGLGAVPSVAEVDAVLAVEPVRV